jgi:hypothetical protein
MINNKKGPINNEAAQTYEARQKLKKILAKHDYTVREEVELDTVTNNMGEKIDPPYRSDMLVFKAFIIELDPQTSQKYKSKGHGTRRRIIHDQWKDTNIFNQLHIKVIRLNPREVMNSKTDETAIIEEIIYQLKQEQELGGGEPKNE